jgi:hypothetical protein
MEILNTIVACFIGVGMTIMVMLSMRSICHTNDILDRLEKKLDELIKQEEL